MGIFKRNKSQDNFTKEQPISGGNLYEVKQKIIAQKMIDLQNLTKTTSTNWLSDSDIQEWYLLQLQANYFINTINFEINDQTMIGKIKDLLRVAFINGQALIKYDKTIDEYIVYYVNKVNYDALGKIKSVNATPWTLLSQYQSKEAFENHEEVKEDIYKDYALLKWGSYGLSAWLYVWPFIKYQSQLLSMVKTDAFSHIKKFVYDIVDPTQVKVEMESWFNPKDPFIRKHKSVDTTNKFKTVELSSDHNSNNIIEMYKQVCGIYYTLFGRRWNNDFKKERSISSEADLTTDNYDVLEKDWIDEFKRFASEFNKLGKLKISVKEQVNEEEMEGEENDL